MRHYTDDQLYDLAIKVAREDDLTPEEAQALRHIAECDTCYHMLCCLMAMQDVSGSVGEFLADAAGQITVQDRISAVIRLAVRAANAVLDQVEEGMCAWTFRRAPMALAGVRTAGKRPANTTQKLTDSDNGQTFVAYDSGKRLLVIQIACADCDGEPVASIRLPQGETIPVRFEKREDIFWAQVPELAEGEYEILLEK